MKNPYTAEELKPENFIKVNIEFAVKHVIEQWELHMNTRRPGRFVLILTDSLSLFRFSESTDPALPAKALSVDYLVCTTRGYITNRNRPNSANMTITLEPYPATGTINLTRESPFYLSHSPVLGEKHLVRTLKVLNQSYRDWQKRTAFALGICPFTQINLKPEEYRLGMSLAAAQVFVHSNKNLRSLSPAVAFKWGAPRTTSPPPAAALQHWAAPRSNSPTLWHRRGTSPTRRNPAQH